MNRLLYALALGLVGAALVCVALLLSLPGLAASQAWSRLAAALPPETPHRLEGMALPVASGDPLFRTLLCRFDLREGPLLVSAAGRSAFWSAAVFTPDGSAMAGVDSAMTGDEAPNLRILLRTDADAAGENRFFPLVVDGGEGLLALRVFVPDESWAPLADALLASVACRSERRAKASE